MAAFYRAEAAFSAIIAPPSAHHPSTITAMSEPLPRTRLFDLDICATSFDTAHRHLLQVAQERGHPSKVVVTPNVDHMVKLDRAAEFKKLYATSDYIFADGMPVVWASKLGRQTLPGRVTGADLFVALCRDGAQQQLSIFVLGGMPGQEETLRAGFARVYPGLKTEIFCPSMQFSTDSAEGAEAARRIQAARPHILFVCLGMPKQEQFALHYREHYRQDNVPLILCVGAAMEFALGQKKRAPLWMQKSGLEWLWRLASEPRRLWQRYTVQGAKFLGLLWREYRAQKMR